LNISRCLGGGGITPTVSVYISIYIYIYIYIYYLAVEALIRISPYLSLVYINLSVDVVSLF